MLTDMHIDLTEIHSLTDFQRNAKAHVERLESTGRPAVLTVNGKAAVVVQDATSYQRMLDLVERAEAIAGIRLGLDTVERGDSQPAREALAEIGRKRSQAKRPKQTARRKPRSTKS